MTDAERIELEHAEARWTAESRLAAATELLREMRHAIPQDRRPGSLFRRSGAFLAAQPAAPVDAMNVDTARERPKASLRAPYAQPLVPESQPAAPDIKTESYCGFEYPSVELSHTQPAAPARTEAEEE